MAKIDQAKLQHIISTIKASPPPPGPGPVVRHRPPISKQRLAAAKMLEATLAKAGLDVTEFNKLLAQDQLEGRTFLKKELAKSAHDPVAAELSYRQRVEENRKLANLLTPAFMPRNTTQIDAPFYISQIPRSSPILKSGVIEPNGSYIKILIETNANNDNDGIFTFWYLWENNSAEDLAISVVTDLIISGAYSIEANPGELWGLFGSDSASLGISNYIETFRYSGWGTNPTTGQSNDNTYYPIPAGVDYPFSTGVPNQGSYAEHGLFDDLFSQIGQGLMFVPAGAVALFLVNLSVGGSFSSGGGNIADFIEIDLNSGGYGVYSPSLWVLTWFRVPPFF